MKRRERMWFQNSVGYNPQVNPIPQRDKRTLKKKKKKVCPKNSIETQRQWG